MYYLLKGGQFGVKRGGQFEAKIHGQLPAKSGDQFKRNFQFKAVYSQSDRLMGIQGESGTYYQGMYKHNPGSLLKYPKINLFFPWEFLFLCLIKIIQHMSKSAASILEEQFEDLVIPEGKKLKVFKQLNAGHLTLLTS